MDKFNIIKNIPEILEYLPKLEKLSSIKTENKINYERNEIIFSLIRKLDELNFIVYDRISDLKLENIDIKALEKNLNNLSIEELLLKLTMLIREGKYNSKIENYILESDFLLNFLKALKNIFIK
jgi:hypothetical protein